MIRNLRAVRLDFHPQRRDLPFRIFGRGQQRAERLTLRHGADKLPLLCLELAELGQPEPPDADEAGLTTPEGRCITATICQNSDPPNRARVSSQEEYLGAVDVEQTAADLAEIDMAAAAIEIENEGYPAQVLAMQGL